MHYFLYDYEQNRNRLGVVGGSGIPVSRYVYDPVGNLVKDEGSDMAVHWNSAGKVAGVDIPGGRMEFSYSPTGQRQVKRTNLGTTYYIHDAAGNVMATYTLKDNLFKVEDLYIYGSGRLGVYRMDDAVTALPGDSVFTRPIGQRQYELTDHLGNVTVTLPDRKIVAAYSANCVSYEAVYLSHTDYYPFGYPIAERSGSSEGYRYGFNGKEKDNEIYGNGGMQDYGFRMYDNRIARFWSVDPLTSDYPELSTYQFASNTPIAAIDLDGLEAKLSIYGTATTKVSDKKQFMAEAKKDAEATGANVAFANTAHQFMDELKTATITEGSIARIVIFSHGNPTGSYFDNADNASGLVRSDISNLKSSHRSVLAVKDAMDAGLIIFEYNALVIFAGCNAATENYKMDQTTFTASYAENFTKTTGISSIGAVGLSSPKYDKEGNYLGRSANAWYRFDPVFDKEGNVTDVIKIHLGDILKTSDYDVSLMEPSAKQNIIKEKKQ